MKKEEAAEVLSIEGPGSSRDPPGEALFFPADPALQTRFGALLSRDRAGRELCPKFVAQVYPDMVVRDASGQIQTVQHQKLTPMLNEVQKQHRQLEAQQHTIDALEQRSSSGVGRIQANGASRIAGVPKPGKPQVLRCAQDDKGLCMVGKKPIPPPQSFVIPGRPGPSATTHRAAFASTMGHPRSSPSFTAVS